MTRKGEAHETLSLLFHRDGVPPTMVTDGSKEQTLGDFRRKLREADCHLRVTEPYSPWQQAAEGCIREIKRGSSRKMISTGSPKPLWDHCLELEALVRSCTCNDIYMTAGQVPETIMTGSTADISHIAEFGWYDWVMYRDNVPSYPDDKLILGRYLVLNLLYERTTLGKPTIGQLANNQRREFKFPNEGFFPRHVEGFQVTSRS